MKILVRWLIVLILCGGLVFLFSPLTDIYLSLIPYDPLTNKFYGETHLWCKIVYYGVSVATVLLSTIPLGLFIWKYKSAAPGQKLLLKRMVLISYLSLILGPGLLANSFFKQNWGRARPYQVIRDHHPFSYPWQPHFNRPADNSFPSGHVTIGAFLGVPFIAVRRRKIGLALCAGGFVLVGTVRWLQGGHYFSDIVMAGILIWIVNILVTMFVDRYFISRNINRLT